jgi:hypothetical protein
MPGPDQLIRAAVTLPWQIARRIIGIGTGLLPGFGDGDGDGDRAGDEPAARRSEPRRAEPAAPDVDPRAAAVEALERDREPVEEAIFTPDEDFFDDDDEGHVDTEAELVAESADLEATEPPGPQLHVDEPWAGYRRMKVAEIVARLDGQPPAVLGAVELYETTHRNRRGVLEAVRSASRD